jgi:hypothetical protein
MIVALIMLFGVCSNVIAQDGDRNRIAVFDPASSGTSIDEGTKIAVREIISSTIVNTGKYSIVERSLLEKVMEEQQFSNSGAVDDMQATEIGKLAGANKIVLSVVTLTGGRNMISIKIIDVMTATIERQKVKVVTSGELLDVLESLTLDMLNIRYETKNRLKCFIISSNEDKVEDKGFSLTFRLYNLNDDAKAIFNTLDMDGHDEIIECEGIWTRHRCLLRSSISINNSKNYLGYSQNNYNPIKYYKIQCSDPRFYIDLLDAHDEEAIVTLPNDYKEGMCLEIVIPDTQ